MLTDGVVSFVPIVNVPSAVLYIPILPVDVTVPPVTFIVPALALYTPYDAPLSVPAEIFIIPVSSLFLTTA